MYEVYVCKFEDEVLYVGQGVSGRHNHCTSGISHVYELNKLHFKGVEVSVDIVHIDMRQEKVLELEKKLIYELQPKFNTVHNVVVKNGSYDIKQFKKHLETKDAKVFYKNVCTFLRGYDDFKKIYKSFDFSQPFMYDTSRKYETRKLHGLESLARNFHSARKSYSVYFLECVNDIFHNKGEK